MLSNLIPTVNIKQMHEYTLQPYTYFSATGKFKKGIFAQFVYVGMQVTVWSFTIRLALNLSNINERSASNFLMTKFNPTKVLIVYSLLGTMSLAYVITVANFSAVYATVFISVLF